MRHDDHTPSAALSAADAWLALVETLDVTVFGGDVARTVAYATDRRAIGAQTPA